MTLRELINKLKDLEAMDAPDLQVHAIDDQGRYYGITVTGIETDGPLGPHVFLAIGRNLA